MQASPVPADVVSLTDYERHAARTVPAPIWAYVAGAAADGLTRTANRSAWSARDLRARVLKPMQDASTEVTLFGLSLPHPILVAPTAYHRLLHPEGERATALGAAAAGACMVVPTQASIAVEEIAAVTPGPLWFQLYLQPDPEDSLRLVRRAEAAGCRALVVTVDAPITGIRNDEARAGFHLPSGVEAVMLRGMRQAVSRAGPGQSPVFTGLLDTAPGWPEIAALRRLTSLPILLKGITCVEDARLALEHGADGIVVSNHGGRVLDGLPATGEALPEVVAAVAGRLPILVDGGLRRGTDILRARALGADAVLLGLPILAALAIAGPVGVAHAITLLRAELEAAMALTGNRTWSEIGPDTLRPPRP